MAVAGEPILLDLASLPREQTGPFLLLGVEKEADKSRIESNWADRLKWARRHPPLVKAPLEDINWAREILSDPEKRVRADASSLNLDTTDGVMQALTRRLNRKGEPSGRTWQPLDTEKSLADYSPTAEVPTSKDFLATVALVELPDEVPAVAALLEAWANQPLDPWSIELPD